MIEVKNLVKKYGSHVAVDHLNFTIEDGRVYGLLGPNGAGKSTTMNIMTGYLGATEGTVTINGHDILTEPEAAKKCIGYLPEMPPLYTEMTVLEYLQFVAELKKIPAKERKGQIREVMDMTKLEDVSDRLIGNLSKGYRQRVGLAQAVLGFPEILILDEPTVGLDPKQIIEIRELIRKLAKNHTVILSSHILAEVREVCEYLLIISNGRLVAADTPENLEKSGNDSFIEIQAKTSVERVKETLRNISAVRNTEYSQEGDVTTARIRTKDNADIREELFRAFARRDIPLLTLSLHQTTLEEIFLQLTQEEAPEEEEEKAAPSKRKITRPLDDDEDEFDEDEFDEDEFDEDELGEDGGRKEDPHAHDM